MMGYGARLAYGCNIGAYFSGVASASLHGWLWFVLAFFRQHRRHLAAPVVRPPGGARAPADAERYRPGARTLGAPALGPSARRRHRRPLRLAKTRPCA
jgi:hypothetical protein